MNWRFIIRVCGTFAVATLVYSLTASFWMSLGILILLAVAESFIIDWWNKRKTSK